MEAIWAIALRYAEEFLNERKGLEQAVATIEGFLHRTPTRDSYFFNSKMTNSCQLNDNIALLRLDGKDVFLDPVPAQVDQKQIAYRSNAEDVHGAAVSDKHFCKSRPSVTRDCVIVFNLSDRGDERQIVLRSDAEQAIAK